MAVNGRMSGCKVVSCGVPQRSFLGPLLFLICINYVDSEVMNVLSKFADDTKVIQDQIQKSLGTFIDWANDISR